MASSEGTPLFRGESATNALKDVNALVSHVFTRENLAAAGSAAKEQFTSLQRQASDGDFSIRLLALVSGVALVVSAGFGFVGLVLSFRLPSAILEMYTFLLGLVMLLLESRGFILNQEQQQSSNNRAQIALVESIIRHVFKYAFFLKFVWGRGVLYVVAGSLQLAQGSLVDYCIGGFVMLTGALYVHVGRQTALKLTQLRQSLSEQTLRSKFREADTDGDGTLSLDNFKVLTEQLGMSLTRREREVAFLCMDRRDSGKITFEDLQVWWAEWEEGSATV